MSLVLYHAHSILLRAPFTGDSDVISITLLSPLSHVEQSFLWFSVSMKIWFCLLSLWNIDMILVPVRLLFNDLKLSPQLF